MTVHKAKGLEFPVVIQADISANVAHGSAGRYVDVAGGLCALRVVGWSPWDLLDHELARDRAEGVRVAYVAATRARDLLVVPAVGDDPFAAGWDAASNGWVAPVHRVLYPPAERRRAAASAPGCPAPGDDSVLERPGDGAPGRDNVQPGLHAFDGYSVVWWDPRCLGLDVRPIVGIRRQELIEDPGREVVESDRKRYEDWQAERGRVQEQGGRPSTVLESVTQWARGRADVPDDSEAVEVGLVDVAPGVERPAGPRFGRLVHAILATVALDATPENVAETVNLQARILGATAEEVEGARTAVSAALAHPLMARAREAWQAERCRREAPVTYRRADGSLVEGILDLAFEADEGWTVIDFKTGAELGSALADYRRQVGLYASIVAKTTGRKATGVLMRV